ncbi:hypothetical protein RIF23_00270 [Lipingzhangella sp. LS1_29]|uniref:Na+/proline symporter n=1 Tax=Lipingzhangella rawalii TaxID=2055835 RepID=A0ABU2H091_9ACTN|nr:hypothetical protein [Lipingzhangella rawalii]MDS1268723.1 hypothetical protein [Lipingzhangella rawalii]
MSTTRAPGPVTAACAICAEQISVAMLLAFTGLLLVEGVAAGWLAVAVGCGYVLLATLVVAPLRRSQVYSLSDFAEWRLQSRWVRRMVSFCAVWVGCLSVLSLFVLAGRLTAWLFGAPDWVGWLGLAVIALPIALAGALGSSTGFQALQFWGLLVTLATPVVMVAWGLPAVSIDGGGGGDIPVPVRGEGTGFLPETSVGTYSLYLALALGVVGFPQLAVRCSTLRDARRARRTVLLVPPLLALLVLVPFGYTALATDFVRDQGVYPELLPLVLSTHAAPTAMGGILAAVLGLGVAVALVAGVSGLLRLMGGAIAQCVLGGGVSALRVGATLALVVPLLGLAVLPGLSQLGLATLVGVVFELSAVTLAPMLILGIWWDRLTDVGVASGLAVGFVATVVSLTLRVTAVPFGGGGAFGELVTQPVLLVTPAVVAVMMVVSLVTARRAPPKVHAHLGRMHLAGADEAPFTPPTAHRL